MWHKQGSRLSRIGPRTHLKQARSITYCHRPLILNNWRTFIIYIYVFFPSSEYRELSFFTPWDEIFNLSQPHSFFSNLWRVYPQPNKFWCSDIVRLRFWTIFLHLLCTWRGCLESSTERFYFNHTPILWVVFANFCSRSVKEKASMEILKSRVPIGD